MISLTKVAEIRLQTFLEAASRDKGSDRVGLRVGAIANSCGGYEYSLKVASAPKSDDTIAQQGGVLLYIDPQSAPILADVAIDYIEGLVQSGFKFINPNTPTGCDACSSSRSGGCGAA